MTRIRADASQGGFHAERGNQEIRNPNSEIPFVPRQNLPDVDPRLCTVCGDCVTVCPTECLAIAREIEVVLAPQSCISCEVCEAVCPVAAIAMRIRDW
jgi:MinD superfamily P-loop ATPase